MIVIVVTRHVDLDDREILGVARTLSDAQDIVDRFDRDRPVDEFWADTWQVGGPHMDTRQLKQRKVPKPWDEEEPTVRTRTPLLPLDNS